MKKYTYCILFPDDPFKVYWDMFVTLLLLYVFFVTPYRIAFVEVDSLFWIFVDEFIDFCFAIDILITFFSAYYNS